MVGVAYTLPQKRVPSLSRLHYFTGEGMAPDTNRPGDAQSESALIRELAAPRTFARRIVPSPGPQTHGRLEQVGLWTSHLYSSIASGLAAPGDCARMIGVTTEEQERKTAGKLGATLSFEGVTSDLLEAESAARDNLTTATVSVGEQTVRLD